MATLHNEIIIQANVEKIWDVLSDPALLDRYDPTVHKSTLTSKENAGAGAKRKVMMKDGKNWFDEEVTVFIPQTKLTYTLTACSFPVKGLKHSYHFEKAGEQTKVVQVMEYEMKFGWLGKLLDVLIVRRQSNNGIKQFFAGLKSYVESH